MVEHNEYPVCEAPEHCEGCDGVGDTKDHFTPKCIAQLWGWKPSEISAEENIQYLSRACHDEKDRSTPARLALARLQLRGAYIGLGDHQIVDDPSFKPEQERVKRRRKKKVFKEKQLSAEE